MYIGYLHFKGFVIYLIGRHIGFVTVNSLAVIGHLNGAVVKHTRNIKAEVQTLITLFDIHCRVYGGVLYLANFADGIPVLLKLPCFIGGNPGKVGLIIGINAGHKLDIRTVFIGKI